MMWNTGRKLLGVLLALVMVVGLIPGMALAASITEYHLWIGNTQVTSNNLSGTGWSYSPTDNKLTLNNYQPTITSADQLYTTGNDGNRFAIYGILDVSDKAFTLDLKGENIININLPGFTSDLFVMDNRRT